MISERKYYRLLDVTRFQPGDIIFDGRSEYQIKPQPYRIATVQILWELYGHISVTYVSDNNHHIPEEYALNEYEGLLLCVKRVIHEWEKRRGGKPTNYLLPSGHDIREIVRSNVKTLVFYIETRLDSCSEIQKNEHFKTLKWLREIIEAVPSRKPKEKEE